MIIQDYKSWNTLTRVGAKSEAEPALRFFGPISCRSQIIYHFLWIDLPNLVFDVKIQTIISRIK